MEKQTLGIYPLPDRTFEYDLSLLERFQEFSAELLRLALLGISAIGIVVLKLAFPEHDAHEVTLDFSVPWIIRGALVAFAIAAASALAHRYFAASSMSWHLQGLRRTIRNLDKDAAQATVELRARYKDFRASQRAIATSVVSLAIGAALIVAAIAVVV